MAPISLLIGNIVGKNRLYEFKVLKPYGIIPHYRFDEARAHWKLPPVSPGM
jgi:hypothetical protein